MDAVQLTVVGNEIEAEMLCGLLRSDGIECNHRKADSATMLSAESGAIARPTEVLVHARDLDAARRLLESR
jgi:hypothetical protein